MASKKIKIGDREVEMLAMSSCNFYYRRLFGEDPFELQAQAASREGGAAMGITFAMQMGFVMKKAAEAHGDRTIMNALTLDEYLDWIDQFNTFDFAEPSGPIIELYATQNKSRSLEKKEGGEPSAN